MKVCPAYPRSDMLGVQPCRAALTISRSALRPQQRPDRLLQDGPAASCTSLGFARDDKGEGRAFIKHPVGWSRETAGPLFDFAQGQALHFASLRSG